MSIRRAYAAITVLSVFGLIGVGLVLGTLTAIKGSYALIGLLLGGGIFAAASRTEWATRSQLPTRYLAKATYVAVIGAFVWTLLFESRVIALLICLPVGYALVGMQLAGEPSPTRLLPQLTAVFSVGPGTKYLTTGMYFGSGDLLKHVGYVDDMVRTGGTSVLSRYEQFPGLHLLAGAIDMVGSLSPDDSLLLVGIVAYAMLVPLIYLLACVITQSTQISLLVATVLTALEPISFFSTYFFPQSLAVVLLLFVLYYSYRSWDLSIGAVTGIAFVLLLGLAAIVTHHLTFIMFVPILLLVVAVPPVLRRLSSLEALGDEAVRPRLLPIVLVWGSAVVYWLSASEFIGNLLFSIRRSLSSSLLAGDAGKPAPFYTYGITLDEPTAASALQSLASPTGLYLIGLVAVTVLSVATVIRLRDRNGIRRSFPLLLAAFVFTPLFLPTPVALPGIDRLQLVLSFFFAFIAAFGLYTLDTGIPKPTRSMPLFVALIVLLGTSGAVVAADDVRSFQAGPQLTNFQLSPGPQVAYSDSEYTQMEETSRFVKRYELAPSSFWISRWTLERYNANTSANFTIYEQGVRVEEGAFLYRDSWSCYEVLEVPESGLSYSSMLFSEPAIENTVRTENKIYTPGETGLLWLESEKLLFQSGGTADPDARADESAC